jgi:hypothetical protein
MHKCSRVACSQFESHSTHKIDFAMLNQSLTKRGLKSVLKAQKHVWKSAESAASKGGGLGVFIDPTQKLAVGIPARLVSIPDTCTPPTVTKSVACVRRQNSRRLPELPTLGTPDVCRNSRLTKPRRPAKEVAARPIPDTSGIWTCSTLKLANGSLFHSILTWVDLSTYE